MLRIGQVRSIFRSLIVLTLAFAIGREVIQCGEFNLRSIQFLRAKVNPSWTYEERLNAAIEFAVLEEWAECGSSVALASDAANFHKSNQRKIIIPVNKSIGSIADQKITISEVHLPAIAFATTMHTPVEFLLADPLTEQDVEAIQNQLGPDWVLQEIDGQHLIKGKSRNLITNSDHNQKDIKSAQDRLDLSPFYAPFHSWDQIEIYWMEERLFSSEIDRVACVEIDESISFKRGGVANRVSIPVDESGLYLVGGLIHLIKNGNIRLLLEMRIDGEAPTFVEIPFEKDRNTPVFATEIFHFDQTSVRVIGDIFESTGAACFDKFFIVRLPNLAQHKNEFN